MPRIRVKNLQTGQTGTIEPQEFSTGMFELLEAPQQAQSQGGLADWLPTIGGIAGSFTPLGPIFGGAAGAAAGTGLKQLLTNKPADLGEIGTEAALGGVGGVIGKGIGSLAGKGASRFLSKGGTKITEEAAEQVGNQTTGKVGGWIKERAAKSVLNTSPSVYVKAAETGIDLNQVYSKYAKALGTNFDEILGPVGSKGQGNLNGLLNTAEDKIQMTIKAAGSNQRLRGDVAIKALREELGSIKNSVDKNRYNALAKIIENQTKLDANGIPLSRALKTMRAANSKFGRSILEEGEGSVANSADKVIANAYRRAAKELYPDIGEALDTQHELLTLEPVLNFARARSKAGSIGLGGLDFTKPQTWLQPFVGNPQIGGRIASGELPLPSSFPLPSGNMITQPLGQLGVRSLVGGQMGGNPAQQGAQEGNADPYSNIQDDGSYNQFNQGTGSIPHGSGFVNGELTGSGGAQQFDEEKLKLVFAQAILQNPKQQAAITAAYKLLTGGEKKPLSATQQKTAATAQSGLKAINTIRQKLTEDPNVLVKAAIPGSPGARVFATARREIQDILTRLRTGAALNEEEIKFYSQQVPQLFDSAETIEYKLQTFEDLLNQMVNQTPESNSLPLPSDYMSAFGGE